jgi:probable phosphoglycerate mutase
MKRLWLIRHGQTDYNADNKIQGSGIDASLNALGQAQAKLLASAIEEKLYGKKPELFASTLTRAKQTATAISEKMGVPLLFAKEVEELNFGIFEGIAISQISAELDKLHELWEGGQTSASAEEGESPDAAFSRASSYIKNAVAQAKSPDVIFVIHGRLLRILLAGWLDHDLSKMSKYHHHNANINLLEYEKDIFKAVILNETQHLASLG